MTNVIAMPHTNYRPSAKYPIRFDNLHPGSTFTIVSEPSRGIYRSTDKRVYKKDLVGFFAEDIVTGKGCCLMPNDIVQPVIKNNKNVRTAGDNRRARNTVAVTVEEPQKQAVGGA